MCRTASCRGVVGDFHDLADDLQQRYLQLEVVQSFIVDEVRARPPVGARVRATGS